MFFARGMIMTPSTTGHTLPPLIHVTNSPKNYDHPVLISGHTDGLVAKLTDNVEVTWYNEDSPRDIRQSDGR